MISGGPNILQLIECDDPSTCGGKAINLGRMLRAGLPVPDGFVISTAAYTQWQANDKRITDSLQAEFLAAYHQLGSPSVAVRSSATAEDLADTSMAGQYETILDVKGDQELIDAIRQCWRSIDSKRIQSYLQIHGIEKSSVAMAVVVQRLVPADVAGVLFTANPRTAAHDEMLIEASWGLGETVVSGMVQPDVVLLDQETGKENEYTVSDKTVCIEPGSKGEKQVDNKRRDIRCLSEQNTRDLWSLGKRAVEHFGSEQDLEWAIYDNQPMLLQSRAITTLDDAKKYHQFLVDMRQHLRESTKHGEGEWTQHNIGETLPHPTPLSWSVVRRFMSGDGGFGMLHRQLGFQPSEDICRNGFLKLIAGRVYMDLHLAPEMYFEGFPFSYDVELLRFRPEAAQQPPTIATGSLSQRIEIGSRLGAITNNLLQQAADCDRRLTEEVLPPFAAWVAAEKTCVLPLLSADQWREVWTERESRVMGEHAAESLLPSMIVAMVMEQLSTFLNEHFWSEHPQQLLNQLAVGRRHDLTIQANEMLRGVGTGKYTVAQWLSNYGHRGPEEFDLAAHRWREQPDEVRKMATKLADSPSPAAIHTQRLAEADRCANSLRAKLPTRFQRDFDELFTQLQRYLPWREDGKATLMLGYDLLRDLALDAGRRLQIGDDVFLLTREELHEALNTGVAPLQKIEERRQKRTIERRIFPPLLITEEEIDLLGEPTHTEACHHIPAVPISIGTARGTVRIVHSPQDTNDLGRGYVLVCPSTDPSWTPLLLDAAAVVLERGGMLSHGAVVAREMGIPAVVLPHATKSLTEGEPITVDGQHGSVVRESIKEETEKPSIDPRDIRIDPVLLPPVVGPGERRAGRLRSAFILIWGCYLAAVFLLPPTWCHDPSIRFLDTLFWPLIVSFGMPGGVALLAVGLALLTMVGQRLLTDNRRLLAARQCAGSLRREAGKMTVGTPRQRAFARAAASVQPRLLGASMVPMAVLLGPMVMLFVWLPLRVDPASWSAPPESVAFVSAEVDADHSSPIRVSTDESLTLAPETSAMQTAPPVRATLIQLLADWDEEIGGQASANPTVPPDMVADLRKHIDRGTPPQRLTWTIYTPQNSGRYPVTFDTADQVPVEVSLVLGRSHPPEPKEDTGDGRGPLQIIRPHVDSAINNVTVTYQSQRTMGDRIFFAPFSGLSFELLERHGWSQWDMGWLLTYIAAYLMALFPLRRLLQVA